MAGKINLRDRAKSLWIKGMKAVGNTAANIANNTRYKVDEVTIQNRRREVLNDLAHKTYALWLKGETFPEAMTKMLTELKQLDEQLNDMRAEKYAMNNNKPAAEPVNASGDEDGNGQQEEDEETDEDPDELPAEDSPVTVQINSLFDGAPSVGKAAQKVNAGLDQMSDRLRNFPGTKGSDESGSGEK